MVQWLQASADPGRAHTEAHMVRAAIEDARDQLALLIGARNREVVFTSGATEAVNAAIWGAMAGAQPDAVIATAEVEHSCVRDASARYPVVALPVDAYGRIEAEAVAELLASSRHHVGLVHCQWGNQEVGTLQPVAEIVAMCRSAGALVHVDAAQAAGHVPIDFDALGADLLSLSGHKFGGPPGSGALVIRRGLRLAPLLVGGAQERARRAGMENAAAICGLGAAASALGASRGAALEAEASTATKHTKRLADVLRAVPGVVRYGDPDERLPHLVSVGIEGVQAEGVLLGLDQAGVAAHSGSACSSEVIEPSPVLAAMGVDAQHSLRFSVGWNTTEDDIDALARVFEPVVSRLRSLR